MRGLQCRTSTVGNHIILVGVSVLRLLPFGLCQLWRGLLVSTLIGRTVEVMPNDDEVLDADDQGFLKNVPPCQDWYTFCKGCKMKLPVIQDREDKKRFYFECPKCGTSSTVELVEGDPSADQGH